MKWYFQVLRKYAVFAGRARRKEYWIFNLIHAVVIFGLKGFELLMGRFTPDGRITLIEPLYVFATFVPLIAVSVRRLHDTNRSGWWFLMFLIPLVNLILFLSFMTEDSKPGENQYGPNPKADLVSGTNPSAV
jgi:uncharacterized membrane protein YhaH (DUF805 family)